MTDMIVYGVLTTDIAHKKWTCQPLQDSLLPFHNSILNSILLEKVKDLFGDVMCSIRGDRTRINTDPDNNRSSVSTYYC